MTNKTKRAGLLCAGFGILLGLGGCSGSGAAQQAYIATDGDLTIGVGEYKQGEWINAACDFATGKVNLTSTHITGGIPIKLSANHLRCDPVNHKLIGTVAVQSQKSDENAQLIEAYRAANSK